MDIGSVLRPDAFRLLLTNFIPGSVATAPWAFGVIAPSLQAAASWSGGAGFVLGVALVVVALTAGTVLEDIGSRIEVSVIDKGLCKHGGPCPDLREVWKKYLGVKVNDELVGQRYLRNFLVRYKFELSMIAALPVSMIGLAVAAYLETGFDWGRTSGLLSVSIILVIFLYREAKAGGEALHELRGIILKAATDATAHPSVQPHPSLNS